MDSELIAYVKSVASKPFAWGSHDCMTFANECARIQRGHGFADEWVTTYKGRLGAIRQYAKQRAKSEYADLFAVADDRLTPVDTLHPRTGMIVARETPGAGIGVAFGVVVSIHSVFVGPDGLELEEQNPMIEQYWAVT